MTPKRKPIKDRSQYNRGFAAGLRHAIILALGGRCKLCKNDDLRVLNIDHVRNDGNAHRRSLGSGSGPQYSRDILRTIRSKRFQILCANCNQIKRKEHVRLQRRYITQGRANT